MKHFEEISVLFHDVYIGSAIFILLFFCYLSERKQQLHLQRGAPKEPSAPLCRETARRSDSAAATQPAIEGSLKKV